MTSSVAETIRDRMDAFTPSERRVARALVADYPVLGLRTVADVASEVRVSSPTVLRFVNRLGYATYSEFQEQLRTELADRLKSPLAKAASDAAGPLGEFAAAIRANVEATFGALPLAELDAVTALLADPRRPVMTLGGRFTDAFAQYLAAHLRVLRPDVSHVGPPAGWTDELLDIGRRTTLVVFDVRRYQADLAEFAEDAAERQATVVLITDRWLSPIARIARHVLAAHIAVPSPWDSNAAVLAIVEALVRQVTTATWPRSQRRMEELERLRGAP